MENKCTGDCLKCPFPQQVYCSAQRTYGLMKNQEVIVERLERIESTLSEFTPKPTISLNEKPAQRPSGAENREEDVLL